ncbi:MAG: DNA-3-methyladenine glycosylase I [Chloroflexota bacterium]|nr:DNA-3-methyladenine glycosylase I [Chloroflexota bacterium]
MEPVRCPWAGPDPLYIAYHDTEWGVPLRDPQRLFELLCLEGAQAGLAWITILRRREGYRSAFHGFNIERMAAYTDDDRARLLADAGIVRNRAKVDAFIGNARAWLRLDDPVDLIWSFMAGQHIENRWATMDEVPAVTDASTAMARGLREEGFQFIGPTICYAVMQSAGLVNDHLLGCFRHGEVSAFACSLAQDVQAPESNFVPLRR